MKGVINQGDILKIEGIKLPVMVVSKDFFNQSQEIIGCPVYKDGKTSALHIRIMNDKNAGIVHCEKMALLDLRVRGYSKSGRVNMSEIIDVTDAIQGIFDYV